MDDLAAASPVEFVDGCFVRDIADRVHGARDRALQSVSAGNPADDAYWIDIFETNAAAVLAALPAVRPRDGYVIRYCFYGHRGGDLLVRPFAARAETDVSAARRLIDWHPPPDSVAAGLAGRPSKDVELLYSHLDFDRSHGSGFYEYWVAVQELWAGARWIHSRVLGDRPEFEDLTGASGWHVEHPVERVEPAVVRSADGGADLVALVYCPLERAAVVLQRVRVGADGSLRCLETIPVARGETGYRLH